MSVNKEKTIEGFICNATLAKFIKFSTKKENTQPSSIYIYRTHEFSLHYNLETTLSFIIPIPCWCESYSQLSQ